MFLAASPRGWKAPKPCLQGIGATTTPQGVHIDVLYVQKPTRAKTLNVRMWNYPKDAPHTLRVAWPNLPAGLHEGVTLHESNRHRI